jgi:hypothetical protein
MILVLPNHSGYHVTFVRTNGISRYDFGDSDDAIAILFSTIQSLATINITAVHDADLMYFVIASQIHFCDISHF